MVQTWMFWVIVLIYMSITLSVAYMGYKKTKGSDDFMLAGRKARPFIIGLSYGATFVSTAAIVGFGGLAGELGMGLIWLTVLNIGVGILFAFLVFGKRVNALGHKLKANTLPDLLGKRYNSPFMQYGPALVILAGMPMYAAAVMLGGVNFVDDPRDLLRSGFDRLRDRGGSVRHRRRTDRGDVHRRAPRGDRGRWDDVLAGIHILHSGGSYGGQHPPDKHFQSGARWSKRPGNDWMDIFPVLRFTDMADRGPTVILGVGIGALAEPQLALRFLTAKDENHLKRAIPIGAVYVLLTTGVAYTVGSLTNVYFLQNTGNISLTAAGGNVDTIMPLYINSATPDIFIAVFMIVLIAAAMSALSSIFHTMGTAAGFDLWTHVRKKLQPEATPLQDSKAKMLSSRIGMGIMIAISVSLAYILPTSIIARATIMFMGLMASAVLPAYAHALFSKNPSVRAAKASLAVGAITWFIWTALVHNAESSVLGISQFFLGVPSALALPWRNVDPLVIGLTLSVTTLAVVWLIEKYLIKDKEATSETTA